MQLHRRQTIRLVGLGAIASLAGCLADDDGGTPTGLTNYEVSPFTVSSTRPMWLPDPEDPRKVVVIDSADRASAVFSQYELESDRQDDLLEFLKDLDYATERVLLIEASGPDLCHSHLDVEDVLVGDGTLRGAATVVDSGDQDTCPEAISYPSSLVRATFDGDPVDEAAIDVTDGWGDTKTISATTMDPISPDPADLPGYSRVGSDPSPIDPLTCSQDSFERHPQAFDEESLHWGDLDRDGETVLSLRVDDTAYSVGDTVALRMTNVTDARVLTGNKNKFNVQVFTSTGWQDVRGSADGTFAYTDVGINHPPGGGFSWRFELTEEGIVEDSHLDLTVCPELQPGRYRFAYFGVTGEQAVAVEFDVMG